MQLSDITVRVFMRCLFNKDFSGVDNWEELYTEYIDLSGLGEQGNLPLLVAIHNLNVRLKFITGFLEFQTKVFEVARVPHLAYLDDVNKYGHKIIWDPEQPEEFLPQLIRIEQKEKRNYVELKNLEKERDEMKEAEKPETTSARNSFVIMLNVLGKEGYKIDKDKTDMVELALMIKQHGEDVQAVQNQS
jgi:hypothetical protein